jgi:hypothetical protein
MIKVTYTKGETMVVCSHADLESCDYVVIGAEPSEAELLAMADMRTPDGWSVAA